MGSESYLGSYNIELVYADLAFRTVKAVNLFSKLYIMSAASLIIYALKPGHLSTNIHPSCAHHHRGVPHLARNQNSKALKVLDALLEYKGDLGSYNIELVYALLACHTIKAVFLILHTVYNEC